MRHLMPLGFDIEQRDFFEAAYNRLVLKLGLDEDEHQDVLCIALDKAGAYTNLILMKISVPEHTSKHWVDDLVSNMASLREVLEEMVKVVGSVSPDEKVKLAPKNYFNSVVDDYLCSLFLTVYRENWPFIRKLTSDSVELGPLILDGKRYIRYMELTTNQMNTETL